MPISDADLQPFLTGNTGSPPSYYSGQDATNGGWYTDRSGNIRDQLRGHAPLGDQAANFFEQSPIGGSLVDSLMSMFGNEQRWRPYANNGRYYWGDPNAVNPVPMATVPGAHLSPNRNYRRTAGNTQAIVDLMPYLTAAVNAGALPTALSEYNASAATSPLYANLMTQLYNQFGPQLNAIGNEIQSRNATASAERDLSVLRGPGQDLVKGAYDTAQIFDKPWYDTRNKTAGSISDLLGSIDLSGGLSGTERSEIDKGNALEGVRRGTANAPSATDTVANAMRFGEKGYQRQENAKSNLSRAIQSASAFLPTARSGVDPFQVATGRSSGSNPGNSLFPGITPSGNNTSAQFGLAGNLLGGMNQSDMNQDTIKSQKKDWLDQFNQFAGGLSSIMGSAGGAAGMFCWVAREVYGTNNPKWKVFRNWMRKNAPTWLHDLYIKYGESFASYISDKPTVKYVIQKLMNYATKDYIVS